MTLYIKHGLINFDKIHTMKPILKKINLSNAQLFVNGKLNPLLTKVDCVRRIMNVDDISMQEANAEYNRLKDIDAKLKANVKNNLTLAEYFATHGGIGSVKCLDWQDLDNSILIKGAWNEFKPNEVRHYLYKYFASIKMFNGVNNPNSGIIDLFEYWFEGDSITIKFNAYTSNLEGFYGCIKNEFGWNTIIYPFDYVEKVLLPMLKDKMNCTNVSYNIDNKELYKSHSITFTWN